MQVDLDKLEAEMSDAELIATKLFGWLSKAAMGEKPWQAAKIFSTGQVMCSNEVFPDLTDWNDIRRMEDAMAAKGLKKRYMVALWHIYAGTRKDPKPELERAEECMECGIWAFDEQRVAAAVAVLREVGL